VGRSCDRERCRGWSDVLNKDGRRQPSGAH
jgi:hypothetical protein